MHVIHSIYPDLLTSDDYSRCRYCVGPDEFFERRTQKLCDDHSRDLCGTPLTRNVVITGPHCDRSPVFAALSHHETARLATFWSSFVHMLYRLSETHHTRLQVGTTKLVIVRHYLELVLRRQFGCISYCKGYINALSHPYWLFEVILANVGTKFCAIC
jgi:hypothetical protein